MKPDSPTYSEELFEAWNSGSRTLLWCTADVCMYLVEKLKRADVREYGKTEVIIDKKDSKVFEDVSADNNMLDEPF